MLLHVPKKGGFYSDQNVIIYDSLGHLFYQNHPKKAKFLEFNLPPGNYNVLGRVHRANQPIEFNLPTLPKAMRHFQGMQAPTFNFGKNPNKATITFFKNGETQILIDRDFYNNIGQLGRDFVRFHELGHFRYDGSQEGEQYCDLFAACEMLKRGYNPSQLYAVAHYTLKLGANSKRVQWLNKKLLKL